MSTDKCSAVFTPPMQTTPLWSTPLVARMRAEDPICRIETPVPAWLITRYEDVSFMAANRKLSPTFDHAITFKRLPEGERRALTPLKRCLQQWFLHARPERHRRVQGILRRYFKEEQ